jgi:SAM-dependent methyltransferase
MMVATRVPFAATDCVNCGASSERARPLVHTRIRHECHLYGLPLRIVVCEACGLVFVNPRPGKKSIETLYSDELYDRPKPKIDAARRTARAVVKVTVEDLYRDLVSALDGCLAGRRILDIGANDGQWLSLFDRSNELVGIEPSSAASRACRDDIRLIRSTLEEAVIDAPADLVTATALIEHLYDPLHGLVKMNSFLKEGGSLFLYTPDVKALTLRRGVAKFFKVVHLYYFSVETLGSLLHKAGFEVASVRRVPQTGSSNTFWILARKVSDVSLEDARRRPPTTGRAEHDAVEAAVKDALKRDFLSSVMSETLMHTRRWRNLASQGLRARFPAAWSRAKQLQATVRHAARR